MKIFLDSIIIVILNCFLYLSCIFDFIGPIIRETATLTSTILRVTIDGSDIHDQASDSKNDHDKNKNEKLDDHKTTSETTAKREYHEINMIGAVIELDTIKDGFKAIKDRDGKITDSDHRFVYKIRGYDSDVGIDLIFNKVKELSLFNQWQEALDESKEIIQTKVNRLTEAKRSVFKASCKEGNLDLDTRFSDKTMPERCVSRSRYSFKNRFDSNSSIRRSASQSQLPFISGKQNASPAFPRKDDTYKKGNQYIKKPAITSTRANNHALYPDADNTAPPLPTRLSASNEILLHG